MRLRRWAAIFLVTLLTLSAVARTAVAQYTEALQAGLTEVTVDGQPIDVTTVPQVANAQPVIAGQSNAGHPTLEIAIAAEDGSVVRFVVEVNPRGRFRGAPPEPLPDGTYALYVDEALVGSFVIAGGGGAGTPEAREGRGAGLDIAQAVPYPFDFGGALPNLGFVDGRFFTIDEEARRTAAAAGDDSRAAVEQTRQSLEAAGWRQRYDSRLAVPTTADPTQFETQVSSFVIEYDSAEAADRAFTAVTGGAEAIESVPIGDASQLDAQRGTAANTGAAYRALRLTFRQDRLLVMVVLADLLDREPDQALVEAAAQSAQARAEALLADQIDGLGTKIQRLDLSGAEDRVNIQEGYEVLGGQLVERYGESQNARDARIANFTGTTAAFAGTYSGTVRPGGGGGRRGRDATPEATDAAAAQAGPTLVVYGVTLSAFPTDADADAWLAGLPDRLATDPLRGYLNFSPVADAPAFGDASAVYEFRRNAGEDQTAAGFRVYTRVGAEVAAVEFAAVPEVALAAVGQLVEGQVDCLRRGRCPNAVAAPALDGSGGVQRERDQAGDQGVEQIGGGQDGGGGRRRDRDRGEGTPSPEGVEVIGG